MCMSVERVGVGDMRMSMTRQAQSTLKAQLPVFTPAIDQQGNEFTVTDGGG